MKGRPHTSLKKKTMFVTILIFAMVGIACVLLFYKSIFDITHSEYEVYCTDLANTVARSLDESQLKNVKDEVMNVYRSLDPSETMISDQSEEDGYDEYLAHFSHVSDMDEYNNLRNTLRRTQDVAHVECLYIIYPDKETDRLVYLVDGAYEDIWDPGTLEILYDTDFKIKGDVTSGFGALMSTDDDGSRIVTTAVPVLDINGDVIAYAGLDYSVDSLLATRRDFIVKVTCLLTFLAAFTAFVVIKLVDRSIVHPINALSEASVQYNADNTDRNYDTHRFADLRIQTGDEIETLAVSMAKMEQDINDYISNLLSTRNELKDTKEYAEEMERNAYKDSLTGVRNKRSYEKVTASLNKKISGNDAEFGLAVIDLNNLKMINDNSGHECGDEAIVLLCKTICEIFSHSPVFRYGGDEFVVILQNRDLNNIEALVARFHNMLWESDAGKNANPWYRYGAAIGYAVFDPDIDDDTSSVFERADRAMYEDKVRIKSKLNSGM